MAWLDKLERRFGFLGIPGLIRIVIGFTALVYVLVYLNRGFELFLTLDPVLILRGQVWRLVTYIFIPQTFSPLWVLLALWFLWFIGEGLERAWDRRREQAAEREHAPLRKALVIGGTVGLVVGLVLGQLAQEVRIACYQVILGDDDHWIAKVHEDFEAAPGQR